MEQSTNSNRLRSKRQESCNDPVVGAILSGWRYDISGISPDIRVDYEAHLYGCAYCRRRQRLHRTVDVLLLAVTSLSFAAFLLMALVMHRLEAISHVSTLHLRLHGEVAALAHIPSGITVSLEAVAIAGVVISMLLWTLVTIATPIPSMVAAVFHERISPELRERLRKTGCLADTVGAADEMGRAGQPLMNPEAMDAANPAMEPSEEGESAVVEAIAAAEDKPIPLWAYPTTYLLMGINIVVFLAMARHSPLAGYWRHHVWSEMFTSMFDVDLVRQFGGSDSALVRDGQWWRLVTATFVHVNPLHILINLWCLWNLGLFGEPLLGRKGLAAVYLLTGVAGNMLSLAWNMWSREDTIVAGASGAVFGIAGILIILLSNRGLSLPWEELRGLRLQVIFFAVVNIALGEVPRYLPYLSPAMLAKLHIDLATMPHIDNSAHIGGFVSGLALGLPLFPKMTSGRTSYRQRQKITFTLAALFLGLIGYALISAG